MRVLIVVVVLLGCDQGQPKSKPVASEPTSKSESDPVASEPAWVRPFDCNDSLPEFRVALGADFIEDRVLRDRPHPRTRSEGVACATAKEPDACKRALAANPDCKSPDGAPNSKPRCLWQILDKTTSPPTSYTRVFIYTKGDRVEVIRNHDELMKALAPIDRPIDAFMAVGHADCARPWIRETATGFEVRAVILVKRCKEQYADDVWAVDRGTVGRPRKVSRVLRPEGTGCLGD